jgi:hypothetical protein
MCQEWHIYNINTTPTQYTQLHKTKVEKKKKLATEEYLNTRYCFYNCWFAVCHMTDGACQDLIYLMRKEAYIII